MLPLTGSSTEAVLKERGICKELGALSYLLSAIISTKKNKMPGSARLTLAEISGLPVLPLLPGLFIVKFFDFARHEITL